MSQVRQDQDAEAAREVEMAPGVRRKIASRYLREIGIAVRPPEGWGTAKPAIEVITDPPTSKPAMS
jgi:hypothetical protein